MIEVRLDDDLRSLPVRCTEFFFFSLRYAVSEETESSHQNTISTDVQQAYHRTIISIFQRGPTLKYESGKMIKLVVSTLPRLAKTPVPCMGG